MRRRGDNALSTASLDILQNYGRRARVNSERRWFSNDVLSRKETVETEGV